MPIRIATAGRQKSVAALAKALFETKGSAETQARAEAALLRANPGIATEGGIKPGVRIVVPDEPDLAAKRAPDDPDDDAEPVTVLARANAATLGRLVEGPVARLIEERKAGSAEVKEIVKRLAASRPEIKAIAAQITSEAAAEAARISKGADAVRMALEALAADLPTGIAGAIADEPSG